MKKLLNKLWLQAVSHNYVNINNFLEKNSKDHLLDLGCYDGELTLKWAKKVGTKNIYGDEIDKVLIKQATKKGIKMKSFDLNKKFLFSNKTFDVVIANQVIEHLYNCDNFISEIHRILKKNGYAIISTENASSWCNIFASIMGWQIFSLTNISTKSIGIGNPFSFFRGHETQSEFMNHVRIYNIRGLKEFFELYGFEVEAIKGAGYFPLPSVVANFDTTHSHFMTFKIRKT